MEGYSEIFWKFLIFLKVQSAEQKWGTSFIQQRIVQILKLFYLPSGWKLLDLQVNLHKKQKCCKSCFRKISSQIQVCVASSTTKSLLCFIVVPIKSSLFLLSICGGQTFSYCRPLFSLIEDPNLVPFFMLF